jgi:hypothetical protein
MTKMTSRSARDPKLVQQLPTIQGIRLLLIPKGRSIIKHMTLETIKH